MMITSSQTRLILRTTRYENLELQFPFLYSLKGGGVKILSNFFYGFPFFDDTPPPHDTNILVRAIKEF